MSANFAAQYRDVLSGFQPLESIDQTRASFGEGVAASFRYMRDEGLSVSAVRAYEPFVDARAAAIQKRLGRTVAAPHRIDPDNPRYRDALEVIQSGELTLDPDYLPVPQSERARRVMARVTRAELQSMALADALHKAYPDEIQSDEQITAAMTAELAKRREANTKIMARSSPMASFVGTAAGAVTDPAILATMPVGGGWIRGGGIFANAARAFGREFLIGAGSEAVVQAEVYEFKKALESPYTKADAVLNILAAGVGGGLLRATGSAAIDTASAFKVGKALRDALGDVRLRERMEAEGLDPVVVERLADEIEARAVSKPEGVTLAEHSRLIDQAMWDLSYGRIPEPPGRIAETDAELRTQAEAFLATRRGELEGEAAGRLTLGDRKALDVEIKATERELTGAGSQRRFRELTDEQKERGLTGRKAKAEAERVQRREVQAVTERLRALEARQAADDAARKSAGDLERLRQRAAEEGPEKLAESLGFKPRRNLGRAIAEAIKELEGMNRQPAAPVIAMRPARSAEVAPKAVEGAPAPPTARVTSKPKVDKGNVPAEARPAEPEPVPENLPDLDVAVAERADGSLETKPVKEAVAELNEKLAEIQRVETCLLRGE